MPLIKSRCSIFIVTSSLTLAAMMLSSNDKAAAQSLQRSGRLWAVYSSNYSISSLTAFANVYDLSNNSLLATALLGPTGGANGNGNARGVACDPMDGNFWFSTLLPGSINNQHPNGDGLIHKKAALGGADIATINDPGGVGGPGIGALDFDPEENVLWATTYWPVDAQLIFYKLNPINGNVLKTFSMPFQGTACCGNTTLSIARPADLIGAKVLLTTAGYTTEGTLYAVDVTSGAIVKTYSNAFFAGGVYGLDVDEITGDLIVLSNATVRNVGPAPYSNSAGIFTIEDRTPEYIWGDISLENIEPLIFIPGIAASELDKTSGLFRNLWLGIAASAANLEPYNSLTLDPDKPDQQRPVIAPDVLRLGVYFPLLDMLKKPVSETTGGYTEYVVAGDPARRTTVDCDLSQRSNRPTLFVFAYDWRRSNAENSVALADYVGCIRKFFAPDTKVNILTHSMGGLLARRYILDNPGRANKLITIAAPWLGAPKANFVMETGQFFGSIKVEKFLRTFKEITEFFPAVHELFPSKSYFDLGGRPFAEAGFDLNGNGQRFETYGAYDQFIAMINQRFPCATSVFPLTNPAATARAFHDYAGQDDWRNDQTGVKYYHIYAAQTLSGTIGKVIAFPNKSCDPSGTNCANASGFKTERTLGDGTVPFFSASRRANGHDLNWQGAVLNGSFSFDHTEVVRASAVHREILRYLKDTTLATPSSGLQQSFQRNGPAIKPSDAKADQQAYYLTVDGADSILVEDCCGNNNALIDGTPFGGEVPGVNIDLLGENTFEVVMPTSIDLAIIDFTITFKSGTEPIFVELLKGDGKEAPSQAIRYRDLNLPPGTAVQLKITEKGGVGDLRYDSDGDGVFESIVTPTASLSGPLALDTEPPVINVTGTYQRNTALVTIAATDESGVKHLRYSLDGTRYQSYKGPFVIDFAESHSLYIYADDFAANRGVDDRLELRPLVSPALHYSSAGGGSGLLDLIVPTGFNWTASSNDTWIILTSADSGNSSDIVAFETRENFTSNARAGSLTIAGVTCSIIQDGGLGGDCLYGIAPAFNSFATGGGSGAITVSTEERCAWQAVSNVGWITVTSGNAGIGNGIVTYSVAANTSGSSRAGTIAVAGKIFSVKQK